MGLTENCKTTTMKCKTINPCRTMLTIQIPIGVKQELCGIAIKHKVKLSVLIRHAITAYLRRV